MMTTNRKQTIRNIIIFAALVNGLAWKGPVVGGDPTAPGLGVGRLAGGFSLQD
jgi:hypothetical protein